VPYHIGLGLVGWRGDVGVEPGGQRGGRECGAVEGSTGDIGGLGDFRPGSVDSFQGLKKQRSHQDVMGKENRVVIGVRIVLLLGIMVRSKLKTISRE